ncbi:MAG: hypothetical protein CMP59_06925 [Flavobacteriales bacterium]|nr:hypothetical protein [Flavobacteriales bacterium]
MKNNRFPLKYSFWPLVLFLMAVLLAFWPRYFSQLGEAPINPHFHAHGVTMTLWCLLLILQPILIRYNYRKLHRILGYFSYLLVPLIFYSIIDLLLFRFNGIPALGSFHLYFVALVVNSAVAFLLVYGLAIYFRKKVHLHARFMIVTVFTILTPVTDRLTYRFAPEWVQMVPVIDGAPIVQVIGFVIADAILLTLILSDWLSGRKPYAFGAALGIMLFMQYTIMNFYKFDFWRSFAEWLLGVV